LLKRPWQRQRGPAPIDEAPVPTEAAPVAAPEPAQRGKRKGKRAGPTRTLPPGAVVLTDGRIWLPLKSRAEPTCSSPTTERAPGTAQWSALADLTDEESDWLLIGAAGSRRPSNGSNEAAMPTEAPPITGWIGQGGSDE